MSAVQAIIAKWDTPAEFGRDIELRRYNHAHLMKLRMSIPPVYWARVVQASDRRGYGVTFEMLADAHASDAALRAAQRQEREAATQSVGAAA